MAAQVLVWDLAEPASPLRVRLAGLDYQSIALSGDGGSLFTTTYGPQGPSFARHDLATGAVHDLPGAPVCLETSTDGRLLVGVDGSHLSVLDADTGELLERVRSDAAEVRLSSDAGTVTAIGSDRAVTVYDLTGRRPAQRLTFRLDRGAPGAIDLAADGSVLYSTSGGSSLRRWDLTGARQFLARQPYPAPQVENLQFVMAAPGGARAVYLVGEGFNIHDLVTGAVTRTVPYGAGYRHTAGAFHPDGDRFGTAVEGTVKVWDLDRARLLDSTDIGARKITELDWSPDGSRLVVSEASGRVSMLDAETYAPVGRAVEVGEPVSFVSAGPDNRTAIALTGGFAGDARSFWFRPSTRWALVDLVDGRVVSEGDLRMSYALWVGYSPDGRYAAVSGGTGAEYAFATGAKGQVAVIDLDEGQLVGPPVTGHDGAAWQLAYSPDGSRILTSGLDGTAALWDGRTGALLSRVTVPGNPQLAAEFLPDGGSARIVDWFTGTAYTWNLDSDRAVAFACRVAGRNLTVAEWRDSFGDRPYVRLCDV